MNKDKIILNIAKENFNIKTLEVRNRDSLDFHDVSVVSIKNALEQSYQAGIKSTEPDNSYHGDKFITPKIYAIEQAEKNGYIFATHPDSEIVKQVKKIMKKLKEYITKIF